MDMVYSAPVHIDAAVLIHVVDDAWATETLPVEDVEVPPSAVANVDDDDGVAQEEEDVNKWNELQLPTISRPVSIR